MEKTIPWVFETENGAEDGVALENLTVDIAGLRVPNSLDQGCPGPNPAPFFEPCTISAEAGVYYLSFYVCCSENDSLLAQRLALWFGSLKDTDYVKMSVSSKLTNIPLASLTTVLGAIANTSATVEITLDQIVMDSLAYFYLLAKKVRPMACGALFVPSYVDNRAQDTSAPWRAVHDFYEWIVDSAAESGRLTEEEAVRLKQGEHAIIPLSRFE